MNILLIAYACEPNKGSEPGVGWNWALHLSKFVNITVVTRKNNRLIIEEALRNKRYNNISFIYYDIPILSKIKKLLPFGVQFYYLLWEFKVIKKIKNVDQYDLIQRLTFVTTAIMLRLFKFNKPYIVSFCAGGEISPQSIYIRYSIYEKIIENIRNYYNSLYNYLPFVRKIYSESNLIIAVTNETKRFIGRFGLKNKIIVEPAIGINKYCKKKYYNKSYKIIYAGSLIYLKNVDIIIKAIGNLNNNKIILDIYGNGNKEKQLRKYVEKNSLNNKIFFQGNITRNELLKKYNEYDLAVHASSHDSGSMFLLEAISTGLPVLFLDTGGPKEIFRNIDYPLKVNPELSYEEIIESFKYKIEWFYQNYDSFINNFLEIRQKIIERFSWENKARRMIEIYKEVLNENPSSS